MYGEYVIPHDGPEVPYGRSTGAFGVGVSLATRTGVVFSTGDSLVEYGVGELSSVGYGLGELSSVGYRVGELSSVGYGASFWACEYGVEVSSGTGTTV